MKFPQYRAYKNLKNYFCFYSETEWEEIQILGSKIIVNKKAAEILPDRFFVRDLLINENGFALVISAEEYERVKTN